MADSTPLNRCEFGTDEATVRMPDGTRERAIVKYLACEHCEACFRLTPGALIPPHRWRQELCPGIGKPGV